mgnify:CR=1 FL=1
MATDLENLATRRSAILTELAALIATAAGGKPNSTAGGIDHVGYKDGLYRELKTINDLIGTLTMTAEGPFEVITQGIT